MRSILSQDREYFDMNTTAVLNERLNHTCRVSAECLMGQPKDLLVRTFKVLVRLSVMYGISPRLFLISMSGDPTTQSAVACDDCSTG